MIAFPIEVPKERPGSSLVKQELSLLSHQFVLYNPMPYIGPIPVEIIALKTSLLTVKLIITEGILLQVNELKAVKLHPSILLMTI